MMTPANENKVTYIIGITFFVYLAIRIAGAFLLDNNWSFTHLFQIPIWYYSIPLMICTSFYYITRQENNFTDNLLNNRRQQFLLFSLFALIFIIFQFDSFLYGGGNYKINQIAQSETIIYRFYEFGTMFFVSLFYNLFSLFDLQNTTAGVFSWKLFSFLGTVLTFIASLLLTKIISDNSKKQFLIFLIIFIGPQTMSYFGFVGYASFIPASLYFFIYFGLQFKSSKSIKTLLILWSITIFSIFMHISLLLLVPALLFVTFKKIIPKKNIAFIIGIKSFLLLTVFLYWVTSNNFEFSKYILFPNTLNMRVDYNLFSLKHISDFLQLLLLFIPQIIIVKFLFFKNMKSVLTSYNFQLVIFLILSSNTLLFILEPTHSTLLDAPQFAVYLSPIIVLLAMLISKDEKNLKYAALFTLFVPLLVLPSYLNINTAEKQIEKFIEKNQEFYIEGATALQDSYFYMQNLDKANYWYLSLPKKSRDYLDLTVAGEYNYATLYSDALRMYYKLKTKNRYWGEPRYHIASIQMKQKNFKIARAEIDTILIIDPFEKEYLKIEYAYYRDIGDFNLAKTSVLHAMSIYPNDYDIQTDLAIMYYRIKDIVKADSTATEVLKNDDTQAFAFLIRGFIAQIRKQPTQAIKFFEEFIRLAPDEPETPEVRKILNNLILQERGK